MDSNLLKEAIADAKAVRQTALANARAALEEAFGSRLEAMFAPQLEEETADQIAPTAAPAAAAPAVQAPALEQEGSVNEADIEEIIRELEAELPQNGAPAPASGLDPAAGQMPPPAPLGAPVGLPPVGGSPLGAPALGAPPLGAPPMDAAAGMPPVGAPPAPAPVSPPAPDAAAPAAPSPEGSDEMDEEIDVNELLESLKNEEDDEKDEDKSNKPPWLKENAPAKSSGIGSSDNKLPSKDARDSTHIESGKEDKVGGGEGYSSGPADATTAKRPNQGKNVTKTNLSTPGGALKENTGGSTPGYPEGAKKTSSGDDASEADRPNQADHATKDDLSTPGGALKKENIELKAQLNEAEQTLTYLRTQLNEINLLNAKLLYTNRLFKEYSMDNNKKMKIVEMFDLAKNVREVKMTYMVVAESLNFGADFKKKTSSKVQNITEGMASQPVAGTAPKQIIAESAKSEMVQKFQRLAGIPAQKTLITNNKK